MLSYGILYILRVDIGHMYAWDALWGYCGGFPLYSMQKTQIFLNLSLYWCYDYFIY